MTAPTIEEQIARQEAVIRHCEGKAGVDVTKDKAILATMQSIKDAGDVVEPEELADYMNTARYADEIQQYIDTLKAKYKLACVERDESAQMNDDQAMRIAKLESERDEFRKDAELANDLCNLAYKDGGDICITVKGAYDNFAGGSLKDLVVAAIDSARNK